MATKLDPREARPLTSREIAKVLCAILGDVLIVNPRAREMLPNLLEVSRHHGRRPSPWHCDSGWELAFFATVAGFRGWCRLEEIDIALLWISEHLDQLAGLASAIGDHHDRPAA